MNYVEVTLREIATDLFTIESDGSIQRPFNFQSRSVTLDFIDFHILADLIH